MQAYFDRDDADLEADSIITQSNSDKDAGDEVADFGRRRYLNLLGFTAVMGLIALLLVLHFGSVVPAFSLTQIEPEKPEMRFVIEIPEPEPEPEKPKPKPKVEPPKPKPKERLRSVPDQTIQEIRPKEEIRDRSEIVETERDVVDDQVNEREEERLQERNTVRDSKRDVDAESATERSLPAVKTPTILAQEDVAERDVSQEAIRQSTVSAKTKTRGEFREASAPRASRSMPEEGLSRIKLDPYTYQMVNVCLRLCVKSMFTHTGMSAQEEDNSSRWLKVSRGSGNDNFSYRFNGSWVQVDVSTGSLSDISNLNFISIPSNISNSSQADAFLTEVTRKLCSVLGYDDCVERL